MYLRFSAKLAGFVLKLKSNILIFCFNQLEFGILITFILATIINKKITKTETRFLIIQSTD